MRSRLAMVAGLLALLAGGVIAVALVSGDGQASEDLTGTAGPTGQASGNGAGTGGRAAGGTLQLKRVGSFDSPLYVTSPPGDHRRVFVVGQGGRIWALVGGRRLRRPFLDISGLVKSGGEQGLLSMAFAPDYARSGRFYVDYTDHNGDTRVQEFRRSKRNPNRASKGSRRQVLFVAQPFENHNGGLVLFGPDKLLYVGLGDGGSEGDPSNNGQSLETLLGKILRINPHRSGSKPYTVPRSNPFVGRSGRDEIYAYGLRNPWRFSFDSKSGDLYIGDVGQDRYEEIDYAKRGQGLGRNYGWSCFEADHRYKSSESCPGAVAPVLEYSHAGGKCAVTGGVVVHDSSLPALAGRYLYGDFCGGQVRSFGIAGGGATDDRSLGLTVPQLSSFGVDGRGRVYLTSLNGPVYRLVQR